MSAESQPSSEESKETQALKAYRQLVKKLSLHNKGRDLVDLNKAVKLKEKEETEEFSVEKLHLAIDDVREAAAALKDLFQFIPEADRKEAFVSLMRADIYLAGHDKKQEDKQRGKRFIKPKKDVSVKDIENFAKQRGFDLPSLKDVLDVEYAQGNISKEQYDRTLSKWSNPT